MDRWNDSLERVLATLVAAERIAVETLGVPFRPIALIRVIEDTPGSHIGRYRKRDELKALGFIDAVVTPGQPTRWTVTNLGIAIAGDATPLKTDAQLLATLRRP